MVNVAQLVRASDCGSEGRGFEPHLSPKKLQEDFVATRGPLFFALEREGGLIGPIGPIGPIGHIGPIGLIRLIGSGSPRCPISLISPISPISPTVR